MENRNITENDIEFYLLNREYNELSVEELSIVSEYVASEQEFNEMKAMLLGVDVFLKEELELEPNPDIKIALLKEFDKHKPAGNYWLNGIFISLFPKEKKIHQKPGMQLVGLAASVLLVVTILLNGNNTFNKVEIAQNEEIVSEEQLVETTIEIEQSNEETTGFENEKVKLKKDIAGKIAPEETIILNMANDNDSENAGVAAGVDLEDDFTTVAEAANYRDKDYPEEMELVEEEEAEFGSVDELIISATTEPTLTIAGDMSVSESKSQKSKTRSSSSAPSVAGNVMDLPKNSRSLAEDADLIGILYTAM